MILEYFPDLAIGVKYLLKFDLKDFGDMRWDSGLCSMFNVVGLKFVHEGKMGKVDVISKSFTF